MQVQTDPHLMPIENNAVYWPPRLSPRIPAAVLRIPKQKFDAPEQLAFASVLSYNLNNAQISPRLRWEPEFRPHQFFLSVGFSVTWLASFL